jgi:hypothetical protein
MKNGIGISQNVIAALAAAAVSSMCVLGTIGPVQASYPTEQVQLAETTTHTGTINANNA